MRDILRCVTLLFAFLSCSNIIETAASTKVDVPVVEVTGGGVIAVKNINGTASIMSSGLWQIVLTWEDIPNATTYNIKRGTSSGAYTHTYSNVKSPYTVSNLEPGSSQYFVIYVFGIVGNTEVQVVSKEYFVQIPIDFYTEKPGSFAMTVNPGDRQATISWDNADRASFYIIQRGLSSGSYPTVVSQLAQKGFVDTNLTNGQKLYYMVIAVNSVGSTNAKEEVVVTPTAAAPGSFGTVTAVAGDGAVTLNWGASTGAIKYVVKRSTSPAGAVTSTSEVNTNIFIDTGLTNGITYYYVVSAVNLNEVSVAANQVSATPMPLPGAFSITAVQAGDSQVQLTWTVSAGAQAYTVQYGTSSGSYPMTFSSSATSPQIVTGLVNGTMYYFRVVAVNAIGSVNSGESSARPGVAGPFTLSLIPEDGQMYLTWTASANATSYTLVRGSSSGSYPTTLSTSATSPYTDLGLTNGTTYYYMVMAVNTSGATNADAEKFATPNSRIPWTKVNGAPGADNYAAGVVSDPSGHVYIAGTTLGGINGNSFGTQYSDFFISKFDNDPSGTHLWTKQYGVFSLIGAPHSGSETDGSGIAMDAAGNVFVLGRTNGNFDGNFGSGSFDVFISKFSSVGVKLWTRQIGSSTGGDSWPFMNGITIDMSGNVIFTGFTLGDFDGKSQAYPGSTDMFVAKYDNDGNKQWTKLFGSGYVVGSGVATDSLGNIYLSGYSIGSFDGHSSIGVVDSIVLKLNSDGVKQWSQQFGNSGNTIAQAMAINPSDNSTYITGYTDAGLGGNVLAGVKDFFITKFDSGGTQVWTDQLGVATKRTETHAVTVDSGGNIFLTGYTEGGLDGNSRIGFFDLFITKYDGTGTRHWTRQFGNAGTTNINNQVSGMSISTDASGNIYAAGRTFCTLDGYNITGTDDYFVVKYNAAGVRQ